MAQIKMLKMPKPPKLGKKPKANASLSTKQAYVRKCEDAANKYKAACKEIAKSNADRKKLNEQSKKLDTVIAGIGAIKAIPASYKVVNTRKKRTTAIAKSKRKATVSGTKKRPVKKAAKKTARRR